MGAIFGTPLACGHREYPEVSKQIERDWKKTIKELKKAISLRKYSLSELEDRKVEAEKLYENLTLAYNDLISKKGNFDKAVNIMKDQKDLVELIRQLTNWICKFIGNKCLIYFCEIKNYQFQISPKRRFLAKNPYWNLWKTKSSARGAMTTSNKANWFAVDSDWNV